MPPPESFRFLECCSRWRRLAALCCLLGSACNLPLEDKSDCNASADCIEGRACVAGQCMDDACGLACAALCTARLECNEICEQAIAPCDPQAAGLGDLNPVECGIQYDLLEGQQCAELNCFDACHATCDLGQRCALVENTGTCTLTCQLEPTCTAAPTECSELDSAALTCWSRGQTRGC